MGLAFRERRPACHMNEQWALKCQTYLLSSRGREREEKMMSQHLLRTDIYLSEGSFV